MRVVRVIIGFVATIMLVFSFVGAGFAVCCTSPVTHGLSWVFCDDATSPFDRNQLAKVADATRDYSFGKHDLLSLYQTIYDVDMEYHDSVGFSAASTTSANFPKVTKVTDRTSISQLRDAFSGASEMYCYPEETISHLDDCYSIGRFAYPLIIAAAILVIVAIIAVAVYAVLDFQGFFTTFHQIFFSKGNWSFPYDSLVICALPTAFWAGMGVVWLLVSFLISLISILIGAKLVRKRR